MSLEKHGKLAALVPDYLDSEYAVLAGWYYKVGRLTLDQAVDIGGFSSKDEFAEFAECRRTRISWVEKAKLIKREKERGSYRNFKLWLKKEFGLNASHTVRLLKAEREFGGTAVEKLPLERVFRLFRLSDEQRRKLKESGSLWADGTEHAVDDLRRMSRKAFFKLTL
jgi:hypothetical protein